MTPQREHSSPGTEPSNRDIFEAVAEVRTEVAVIGERLSSCRAHSDEYHAVVDRRLSGLAREAKQGAEERSRQRGIWTALTMLAALAAAAVGWALHFVGR